MGTHYLFDVSRLLSRAAFATPTGIDRVELAYAKHFLTSTRDRPSFAAASLNGRLGPLPFSDTARFLQLTEARWRGVRDDERLRKEAQALARSLKAHAFLAGEAALFRRERRRDREVTYVHVSHHHLDRPGSMRRLKKQVGARCAFLVHDLIPIQFPEYAKRGQANRHAKRMETVADLADVVIFNSECTGRAFQRFYDAKFRDRDAPRMVVAPLGVESFRLSSRPPARGGQPYFVCIATIEPKKNHLLLLNIWRSLAEQMGDRAPRLVLVGRRGWENENIVDLLERSEPVRKLLEEYNNLPDQEVGSLLAGARALLMPSFAEGFGLPVAEAMAAGTPVLCSDLPALREVGKDVPEYFDPLDGPGWRKAVLDYAAETSPRRDAQLARLEGWRPPAWRDHFAIVEPALGRSPRMRTLPPRSMPIVSAPEVAPEMSDH